MGAFTTMTSKGQLTIPKDVRDGLNLSPGTRFYVTIRKGQVVAVPKNKSLADLAGILGPPPNGVSLTVEEMNEAVMDAVAADDQRIVKEWAKRNK
ncbi:AbrB/MazE/SpoVT family DNA-binding domain-containing protein [Rhizobium sp. TH2]|uniref:AbrB/MazE/SpoVT family DNA-binding domain-containing protein n=1 Tax=Rhizobium sp. TH2 TaxID=2775403 RepID=UPI002157B16F|nr:AbrB/MazE/SpoVT family DNA-binding domain-containing protein [Rhizobium sp. TH2]UVC07641.1 AbrB/MazE/SpoVT family DNA-binding domain-containing protein [Rhizobium sp. TH2]